MKFNELPIEEKMAMFEKHCLKYGLRPREVELKTSIGYQNQYTQFNFSLYCETMICLGDRYENP